MMAITTRQARRELSADQAARREAVRQELEAVAASQITDVVQWHKDELGQLQVNVVDAAALSPRARRGIKKVKITPTEYGKQIEIEMHDKLGALRLLAKAEGLLAGEDDQDKRPSLVGINIRGPKAVEQKDGADE